MATKEMAIEYHWHGPGWYASRQLGSHDNQRVSINPVYGVAGLGEDAFDIASTVAYGNGQGTPFYAKEESDLERV